MIVACIGTRRADDTVLKMCYEIGHRLASAGHIVRSGNAVGPDQAFARGAWSGASPIGPWPVVCLPWPSYNLSGLPPRYDLMPYQGWWEAETAKHHPAWNRCSSGAQKLHSRNMGIVAGEDKNLSGIAGLVIAARAGDRTGGTEQGVRIANAYGITVLDVSIGVEEIAEEVFCAAWCPDA